MVKIFKKTKKNKGPAKYRRYKSSGSGFVMLFAVSVAGILLSIALGVANISLNEARFNTSARATSDAFTAADTGVECALFHDKTDPNENAFTGTADMYCVNDDQITITPSGVPPSYWEFVIPGLGSLGQSCAVVSVSKLFVFPYTTTIVSKGYNIGDILCDSSSLNRAERELRVTFGGPIPEPVLEDVVWQNAAGVDVDGNDIEKTASTSWSNAGASSVQSFASGDGFVEFSTSESNRRKVVGLGVDDSSLHFDDVDFGFYLKWNGTFAVVESGIFIPSLNGTLGNYSAGDTFIVANISGQVKYYQNDTLVYTSTNTPSYPMLLDTSLYKAGSTVTDARISYDTYIPN